MHPVIFKIGSFPVHSYGLMLALSFLIGIWFSSWRAKRRGLDPNVISDVGFWIIISAIAGSRIYYIFLHFEEFRNDFGSMFNPFHEGSLGIGGLVMYGGFLGALLAGVLFFKIKKLPFLPYADAVAPSIGLGIFLTRIGCFLNGCCFGDACTWPVAVSFPRISPAGYHQHAIGAGALHPSQLYESAGGLIILLVVLLAGRKKKRFPGLEFYLVGVMYSVLRFFVDMSRVYAESERLGPLSHNQVLCIALFIVFTGLLLKQAMFAASPASETMSSPPPPSPPSHESPPENS